MLLKIKKTLIVVVVVTRLKQFNSLIITMLGTSSNYKVVRIVVGNLKVETRNFL